MNRQFPNSKNNLDLVVLLLSKMRPLVIVTTYSTGTKDLSSKSNYQRLPRLPLIVWVLTAFILVGCEPARNFLPRSPQLNAPSTEPQALQSVQSGAIVEMEAEIRQQINKIRQQNGLNPLENNERLAQVARNYSQTMARENFFSHTGPKGDTPAQRVREAGISYWVVGENLFRSTNIPKPVPSAVKGWMDSQGHRENILRPEYAETGVGIWRDGNTYYITQLFMRSQFSLRDLFP